jgi:Ni,Fe-hydrogenase III large subunit
VNKIELIKRLRIIILDLRRITSHSKFLGEETADIEYEIDLTEKELAKLIDDYMAAQIARHNRERGYHRR